MDERGAWTRVRRTTSRSRRSGRPTHDARGWRGARSGYRAPACGREQRRSETVDDVRAAVGRFKVFAEQAAVPTKLRGTIAAALRSRLIRQLTHIPTLGAAATPLRFLDYLIEETQPGAVLGGRGALVNVPRPGRYALHKLIVAGRRGRGSSGTTKAGKDRVQASALLRVLLSDLPGEITLAWKALALRGKRWVQAVRDSVASLDADLVAELRAVGITPAARRTI